MRLYSFMTSRAGRSLARYRLRDRSSVPPWSASIDTRSRCPWGTPRPRARAALPLTRAAWMGSIRVHRAASTRTRSESVCSTEK